MTDAEKIRAAWAECPPFDERRRWRVQVPTEAPVEVPAAQYDADTFAFPECHAVEFRHERGMQEGRPARRIIGRFRDTEVCVAFAFI